MPIKLTNRDNKIFILKRCYEISLDDENWIYAADAVWLAHFLMEEFSQCYFDYEYIKNDPNNELKVLVSLSLGDAKILLSILPNQQSMDMIVSLPPHGKVVHKMDLHQDSNDYSTLNKILNKIYTSQSK